MILCLFFSCNHSKLYNFKKSIEQTESIVITDFDELDQLALNMKYIKVQLSTIETEIDFDEFKEIQNLYKRVENSSSTKFLYYINSQFDHFFNQNLTYVNFNNHLFIDSVSNLNIQLAKYQDLISQKDKSESIVLENKIKDYVFSISRRKQWLDYLKGNDLKNQIKQLIIRKCQNDFDDKNPQCRFQKSSQNSTKTAYRKVIEFAQSFLDPIVPVKVDTSLNCQFNMIIWQFYDYPSQFMDSYSIQLYFQIDYKSDIITKPFKSKYPQNHKVIGNYMIEFNKEDSFPRLKEQSLLFK